MEYERQVLVTGLKQRKIYVVGQGKYATIEKQRSKDPQCSGSFSLGGMKMNIIYPQTLSTAGNYFPVGNPKAYLSCERCCSLYCG